MEELQSTDILAREILEDARKKAQRILKNAESTMLTQTAEWKIKTDTSLDELKKKYAKQYEISTEKIMARLPIDKHRAKAEKIETLICSAVESWYNGLSRTQIHDLLTAELTKRIAQVNNFKSSGPMRAFVYGLEQDEAEKILKSAAITCTIEKIKAGHGYPFITAEAGNVRITASIQKTIDFLLQEKRAELVEALLGSAFTEGE